MQQIIGLLVCKVPVGFSLILQRSEWYILPRGIFCSILLVRQKNMYLLWINPILTLYWNLLDMNWDLYFKCNLVFNIYWIIQTLHINEVTSSDFHHPIGKPCSKYICFIIRFDNVTALSIKYGLASIFPFQYVRNREGTLRR